MRTLLIIFLLISSLFHAAYGEEGLSIIKNFGAETYGGGSRIYSIVGTKDGVLYAGDKNGVIEFDGENWNKIDCGFTVTSLAVDTNDVVYIAGSKGIGTLMYDSSHVLSYKSLNHFVTTDRRIRKFRFSKVFNVQNRIVYVLGNEIIINTSDNVRIIESPYHFTYYQKLNNELYFYSPNDGVYQLVENKLLLVNDRDEIKNKNIVGFLRYNGQLHILIAEAGIYNLSDNHDTNVNGEIKELLRSKIQGIDQLDDSTYALKTFYKGVVLLSSDGEIINRYHFNEGLINNTVFSVFKDYWNNLWIGTAAGISVIRLNFPFTKFNNHDGIGTGYSTVQYNGKLFFATSQGLYYATRDDKYHLNFIKVFDGHIWGLHVIENVLYFSGASGIYSWNNDQITQISYYPGGWYFTKMKNNSNYYLTGTMVGIMLFKKGESNVLKEVGLIDGINANVRNIEVDSDNNYWAESEHGIYRFNINDDFNAENVKSFDRVELHNNLKRILKFNDELFFLADSAIYTYHKSEGFKADSSLFASSMKKRIPSNIIIDDFNRVWMFTNGKLSCYRTSKGVMKKVHLGMIEYANETYPIDYESVYSVDSNFVIFGQEEGFIGYSLKQNYKATYSANRIRRIVVTSRAGKEKKLIGSEKVINWVQYGQLDAGIKHGNSIKFYYSAGCSQYNAVKYATFLHGFDKEWPNWNNETIKEYTNLPAGEYKFIVRSINKSNEESIPAIYNFKVLPPWYFTWIAKIIYVVLLFILIFAIERSIRYRTVKLKDKLRKEQEDELFRKEQAQIQEDLKKKQEIIKLRNEKLRIDNLYKSKELANSTMGVIKKNQFLTELKEELEKIREYAQKNKLVTGDIKDVIRKIDKDIDNEENWKVFEDYFDRVHEKFLNRLKTKYPILTAKDLRLSAYLRMNLSTKEIAPLMNITIRGVEISRYRLRKKIELDRNENLNEFLLKF